MLFGRSVLLYHRAVCLSYLLYEVRQRKLDRFDTFITVLNSAVVVAT